MKVNKTPKHQAWIIIIATYSSKRTDTRQPSQKGGRGVIFDVGIRIAVSPEPAADPALRSLKEGQEMTNWEMKACRLKKKEALPSNAVIKRRIGRGFWRANVADNRQPTTV